MQHSLSKTYFFIVIVTPSIQNTTENFKEAQQDKNTIIQATFQIKNITDDEIIELIIYASKGVNKLISKIDNETFQIFMS